MLLVILCVSEWDHQSTHVYITHNTSGTTPACLKTDDVQHDGGCSMAAWVLNDLDLIPPCLSPHDGDIILQ